ncbi:MAG: ABC transporter substrate-binding protein [Chitinophagales bacterium]|nr:ABC transporter substrate-binding protein [Chitinophagales bacterium]MDW8418007.1 ABC transporter substrate-binding protein [Chitinophagales bacterium]
MKINSFIFIVTFISFTLLYGCKGRNKGIDKETVVYRESADPDMLNPINSSSANATVINDLIFGGMQGIDPKTFELTNVLLKEEPKFEEITEGEFKGGMKISFEIKDEARWDNGTPVTGEDYVFTIKSIINPKTNCEHLKGYYSWLGDIVVDSVNNRKVTVYSKEKYFKISEFAFYRCLPEYVYDPQKIMRKFTIRDLVNNTEKLKGDPDIIAFANEFNSEKHQRDTSGISGFGPYRFVKWTTGQEIIIERKKDWWGDKFSSLRDFWAFPKKIIFKIIPDNNTAFAALKDDKLSAYEAIDAKRFKELEENELFASKFNLHRMDRLAYNYIGFNMRKDKLKDVRVRKAIAMAIDRDLINKTLNNGESTPATTFVHPVQDRYINKDIKPIPYNVDSARALLAAAGWKDTDGDGFLDKNKEKFTLEFKMASGNDVAKQQALMIKEQLKKVGIELNIVEREWTVYLQEMDKFDFELNLAGWTIPARVSDPYQLWHTKSAVNGGSNYTNFGNAETDKVIEELRSTLDENKRIELYKRFQKMLADEQPVVFMFYPKNRMAISKKFEVEPTMINPGFNLAEFKPVDL